MFCGSSLQGLIFIFDKTRLKATQRKVEVLKLVALFVYQLPLLIVPLAQLFYHIRVGRHCLVEGTWLYRPQKKKGLFQALEQRRGRLISFIALSAKGVTSGRYRFSLLVPFAPVKGTRTHGRDRAGMGGNPTASTAWWTRCTSLG